MKTIILLNSVNENNSTIVLLYVVGLLYTTALCLVLLWLAILYLYVRLHFDKKMWSLIFKNATQPQTHPQKKLSDIELQVYILLSGLSIIIIPLILINNLVKKLKRKRIKVYLITSQK